MLKGIGIDIIEFERIQASFQKLGQNFIQRILHPKEIQLFSQIKNPHRQVEFLAGRFAAKEAYMKASGQGMQIPFNTICILNNENGMPYIQDDPDTLISISHSKDYAAAMAVKQ